MKKIVFIIICLLLGIFIGGRVLAQKESPPKVPSPTSQANVIKQKPATAVTTQVELPQTLSIPSLNIEAPVESVGMDAEGRMDVPKDDDNVAWYNLGFKPGDNGSAVIAGHFDRRTGGPAVFYDLNKIKIGDSIVVTSKNGEKVSFTVTDKKQYPFDDFPLEKVFNTTDKPRLNLITCDGVWSSTQENYSQRLVIFAELSSS